MKTDPRIAKSCKIISGYKCEINSGHETFRSQVSNKNYVEVHHLIPLKDQQQYGENSLDHEANIYCLCPNCHRLLHHAIFNQKSIILKELFEKRKTRLRKAGINLTIDNLLNSYQ